MNAVGSEKREGALGTKVEGCSFFEGVASHTVQARPLGLRIEKAEALQATGLSQCLAKEETRIAEPSLR
jgi:hypothetical protein